MSGCNFASDQAYSFPETARSRPAFVGDRGIVLGVITSELSGVAQLAIRISDTGIALLSGDWRCIRQIADDLLHEEIEVVESENSIYGCHSVRSLRYNIPTDQLTDESKEVS